MAMDLGFLSIDFSKIGGAIKEVIIKILTVPFKMFNALPGYVKGGVYVIGLIACLLIIYLVWKNRDEWLRVDYG